MKVLSIFLTMINSIMAGLLLLSCISISNLSWDGLGWLAARTATGILVIFAGIQIFRDGVSPINPGKILLSGLLLVLLGVGSAMWGIHLSIISGDVKNVMILFGAGLVLQGISSLTGLSENNAN